MGYDKIFSHLRHSFPLQFVAKIKNRRKTVKKIGEVKKQAYL